MGNIKDKLQQASGMKDVYKPQFFRLSEKESREKFDLLLVRNDVHVYDEINSQIKELIKSRNPRRRLTDEDYAQLIKEHLSGVDSDEFGVWVYYPWSGRVVHILDESEYVELRTSANRHKITTAERDLLATKKVGVIGLSVGQSVSVTIAMERGCGELRLADFDTLELNNMNRIRTGVHNLGIYKAYSVAREIAEIDPYFKVVCYTEGITDNTIDDFFTKDGKLDLVIDECDGVNVKILCRIKAKELHIPVLMEASDRGTLDVERFDLDKNRPIMHGWLKHLPIDLNVLSNLKTPDEKLAYILPISGLETLSSRMRASMIEIQNTITTWPQLATAVTLGGAITADTARRIFLNQFTDSGRYFIDMESLVRDIRPKKEYSPGEKYTLLDEHEMRKIAEDEGKKLKQTGFAPEESEIKRLVDVAIKAPSAGNSQPWKWLYAEGALFVFAENEEYSPYEDYNNGTALIACGAAIENLELEARRKNMGVQVKLCPNAKNKKLAAIIQFTGEPAGPSELQGFDDLVNYIDYRITNRAAGNGRKPAREKCERLQTLVATVPGAELTIIDDFNTIDKIAAIAGIADRISLLHAPSHFEFFRQLRWSNDECMRTGDGVHIDSLGLSQAEIIAMRMIKKQEVIQLLSDWRGGQALEYTARKAVASSFGVGLLTMPDYSPLNYILAGKAIQRMWLSATKSDISIQPMQAAVLQFTHLSNGRAVNMPDHVREEITEMYDNFSSIFHGLETTKPVFMFRMSIAEKPVIKTYRRQIEKVLFLPNNR